VSYLDHVAEHEAVHLAMIACLGPHWSSTWHAASARVNPDGSGRTRYGHTWSIDAAAEPHVTAHRRAVVAHAPEVVLDTTMGCHTDRRQMTLAALKAAAERAFRVATTPTYGTIGQAVIESAAPGLDAALAAERDRVRADILRIAATDRFKQLRAAYADALRQHGKLNASQIARIRSQPDRGVVAYAAATGPREQSRPSPPDVGRSR